MFDWLKVEIRCCISKGCCSSAFSLPYVKILSFEVIALGLKGHSVGASLIITCGEGLGVSASPGVLEADELVIYDLG